MTDTRADGEYIDQIVGLIARHVYRGADGKLHGIGEAAVAIPIRGT